MPTGRLVIFSALARGNPHSIRPRPYQGDAPMERKKASEFPQELLNKYLRA
jgi:hypothetical protein